MPFLAGRGGGGIKGLEAAWPLKLTDHTQSIGTLRAATEPTTQNGMQMVCKPEHRGSYNRKPSADITSLEESDPEG